MKKNEKKKPWIRTRHSIVRNLLYMTLGVYSRLRYNIKIDRFKEQEKRPYLVLMNHQTPHDQFFVGMSVRGPIYYLASEDIFSNGWVSSLIKYLVAPIPIKKQTMDVRAVFNCIRVAKEGGTIAIAPEGNRTYSGRTEYINPAIASLARKLGMPILLYRIEGGYGTHPRWSDVVRRGKMHSYVSRVISPEEYATLTDEELFDIIKTELYVDEAVCDREFYHKKNAEYLERLVYVCPFCGLSTFKSQNDTITCEKCKRVVRYLPTKELSGVGFDFPYRFVADWYEAQKTFVNNFDTEKFINEPIYSDSADLYEVIPYKKKNLIAKNSRISVFGDRIELDHGGDKTVCLFEGNSGVTVLGRNKLNIYSGDKIYQLKGAKGFNAIKYVNLYHRSINIRKGNANESFLGL